MTYDAYATAAYWRRRAADEARDAADLGYAVGRLDAALSAHGRAVARSGARRRTAVANGAMLARMAVLLAR